MGFAMQVDVTTLPRSRAAVVANFVARGRSAFDADDLTLLIAAAVSAVGIWLALF
jgi:hypothetical protein